MPVSPFSGVIVTVLFAVAPGLQRPAPMPAPRSRSRAVTSGGGGGAATPRRRERGRGVRRAEAGRAVVAGRRRCRDSEPPQLPLLPDDDVVERRPVCAYGYEPSCRARRARCRRARTSRRRSGAATLVPPNTSQPPGRRCRTPTRRCSDRRPPRRRRTVRLAAAGVGLPRRLRLVRAAAAARRPTTRSRSRSRVPVLVACMQARAADRDDVGRRGGIAHAVAVVAGARDDRDARVVEVRRVVPRLRSSHSPAAVAVADDVGAERDRLVHRGAEVVDDASSFASTSRMWQFGQIALTMSRSSEISCAQPASAAG